MACSYVKRKHWKYVSIHLLRSLFPRRPLPSSIHPLDGVGSLSLLSPYGDASISIQRHGALMCVMEVSTVRHILCLQYSYALHMWAITGCNHTVAGCCSVVILR